MITYEGIAVHWRLNETYRYQVIVPFEVHQRCLGVTTDIVNKSGQLLPEFIAVHPAEQVYETVDVLAAAQVE